ncbi:hypothetical protein BaRGS_00019784, partial [Batillaria attramentaria]
MSIACYNSRGATPYWPLPSANLELTQAILTISFGRDLAITECGESRDQPTGSQPESVRDPTDYDNDFTTPKTV